MVQLADAVVQRLALFLDRQEVADLVMKAHAITDRWRWEELPPLLTEDCVMEFRIDSVPIFASQTDANKFTPSTNWREANNVRGHHQWANVIVTIEEDAASVYMSGTQTNTYPNGEFETSGVLQEAGCRRTPDGWKIAKMGGSYESNHPRLDKIFAKELEGQKRGFRR